MRVNRKFLYWGVFFVAMGGVMVAADLAGIDDNVVTDALRLWPVVVVAFGLALIMRRTRFSLAGGLLAAAVPGLVLGGALAAGPHVGLNCGSGEPPSFTTQQGTFIGDATVDVTSSCGDLTITTAPGSGWQLQSGNTGGNLPTVTSRSDALTIGTGARRGWFDLPYGRDVLRLTLPTSPISSLSLVVNAGAGHIDLAGAQVRSIGITNNAAASTVDLSTTAVSAINGTVNAGALSVHLPAGQDFSGTFDVNAGALQVCAPSGLGFRVHHTGVLGAIRVGGANQTGDWQSPDYLSAAHHADLAVSVNVGGVDINPIGGCK